MFFVEALPHNYYFIFLKCSALLKKHGTCMALGHSEYFPYVYLSCGNMRQDSTCSTPIQIEVMTTNDSHTMCTDRRWEQECVGAALLETSNLVVGAFWYPLF